MEKDVVMDIEEIKKYIPHRYPFLFVDKVIEVKENLLVAIKNVTGNESYFQGHFPGYPVMPGVLQVEALAQAAALFVIYKHKLKNKPVYFMSLEKVKFRNPVFPGDTLRLEVSIDRFGGRIAKCSGKAFVGDKITVESKMMAMIEEQE
ncbi:MAG: 3-hydroxyacyl-[acyl-carrier-protein] dehydratase FabZ [Spirochaetes bacterium]|nr:MAG: 3-hydroxyacyl-[acyl-carrier-protein] dehydratase FabZ [Spirochaetota bacterium]